jgi:3-dehydroquinate dehydratase II
MKKIAIINGPNLDRLGKREPEIYGSTTLAGLEAALRAEFAGKAELAFFQSNHEGELIDRIAGFADAKFDGLVINAGAFTHTSVALRDALLGAHLPTIEVHISNIYRREEFRHTSLTAPACVALISGLGLEGYHAAVRFLLQSPPAG